MVTMTTKNGTQNLTPKRVRNFTPLFSVYKIDETRNAIKSLFNENTPPEIQILNLKGLITIDKDELPDNYLTTDKEIIKISDSTYRFKRLSIAETVGFNQNALKKNRSAYPYQSKKFYNQPTTFKVRYGTKTDQPIPRMKNLKVDKSELYVTVKCAICGYQRRVKVTKRNSGRDTIPCFICNSAMFIKKVVRGSDTLYDFETDQKFVRVEKKPIPIIKTDSHGLPKKAIEEIDFNQYLRRL